MDENGVLAARFMVKLTVSPDCQKRVVKLIVSPELPVETNSYTIKNGSKNVF